MTVLFFELFITLLFMEMVVIVEGSVGPNNRKPPDLINRKKITFDDEPEVSIMDKNAFQGIILQRSIRDTDLQGKPQYYEGECVERAQCYSDWCDDGCWCSHASQNQKCRTPSDCCGRLNKCINGTCIANYYNEPCQAYTDCYSGKCNDKSCLCGVTHPLRDRYCKTKQDCCGELQCVGGKCQQNDVGEKCDDHDYCYSDHCTPAKKCGCGHAYNIFGKAVPCKENKECCSKRCIESFCDLSMSKESCDRDQDCYTNNCYLGRFCDDECPITTKKCKKRSDCCASTGYECQGGTCCKQNRQSCSKNEQCCSKRCILGTCDLFKLNEKCLQNDYDYCHTHYCVGQICKCVRFELLCTNDVQCCDGLYCIHGSCQKCLKNERSCKKDIDCCERNCDNGICKCKSIGKSCIDGSKCCPNLFCRNGKCNKCLNENERCPGREGCCTGSQCHDGYCKRTKKLYETCKSTLECTFHDINNICRNKKCLISDLKPCKEHKYCASGYCTLKEICCKPKICNSNQDCCGDEHICKQGIGCCVLLGGYCSKNIVCCLNECIGGRCENYYYKQECTKNEECHSGSCVQEICGCSDKHQICRDQTDCCAGRTCYKHICKDKIETSRLCDENDNCITNHCSCPTPPCKTTKFCMCKSDETQCANNNECCPPKKCHGNECCVLDGTKCRNDEECCKNSACLDYICKSCSMVGKICNENTDCCPVKKGFSNLCHDHVCVKCVHDGGKCSENKDCCGGYYTENERTSTCYEKVCQ